MSLWLQRSILKLILHWPLASRHKQWSSWGQQRSYLCSILTIPSFTPPPVHSHSPQFHTVFAPPSWAWPPATSGAGSPLKFSANLLTSASPLIGSSPACVRMLGSSAHVLNNNERKCPCKDSSFLSVVAEDKKPSVDHHCTGQGTTAWPGWARAYLHSHLSQWSPPLTSTVKYWGMSPSYQNNLIFLHCWFLGQGFFPLELFPILRIYKALYMLWRLYLQVNPKI